MVCSLGRTISACHRASTELEDRKENGDDEGRVEYFAEEERYGEGIMTPDMGKMTLLRVMDAGCRGWEAPIIVDAACPANDVTTAMLSWANQPCPIPAQRSAQIKRHNTTRVAKQAWRMRLAGAGNRLLCNCSEE